MVLASDQVRWVVCSVVCLFDVYNPELYIMINHYTLCTIILFGTFPLLWK